MTRTLKNCAGCGVLMHRKLRGARMEPESWPKYERRQFCSVRCHVETRLKKKPRGKRFCEHCGDELTRKVWPGGSIESAKHLRRRRYCDAECAALAVGSGRGWGLHRFHALRIGKGAHL